MRGIPAHAIASRLRVEDPGRTDQQCVEAACLILNYNLFSDFHPPFLTGRQLGMHSAFVRHVSLLAALATLMTCSAQLAAQDRQGARSRRGENTRNQGALEGTRNGAQAPDAVTSNGDSAKAAQNPLSSLIIVGTQIITDFKIGPHGRTRSALNLLPIVPMRLNTNWTLSTWVNLQLAYQPNTTRITSGVVGLSDVQPTFFLSPVASGKLTWGLGPTFLLPTATDVLLRTGRFSVGPAALVLAQPGKWTIGAMVNQLSSVGGSSTRTEVNKLSLNYFVNYNLPKGWYLISAPALTADWTARPMSVWTVPVGGGVGRITKVGPQLVNVTVAAYWNALHDSQAAGSQLFFQLMLLYPKKSK